MSKVIVSLSSKIEICLGAMTCTIEMSHKELSRKTAVERALELRSTQKAAAKKLGISERQFKRILRR